MPSKRKSTHRPPPKIKPKEISTPKRDRRGQSFNPEMIPAAQRAKFLTERHAATLKRLHAELEKCYRVDASGRKILWKRDNAAAILTQIKRLNELME